VFGVLCSVFLFPLFLLRFWQILTKNLAKLVELTLEKRKISNEFPISLWENGEISPQKKALIHQCWLILLFN
jgi:hypothetical protein